MSVIAVMIYFAVLYFLFNLFFNFLFGNWDFDEEGGE